MAQQEEMAKRSEVKVYEENVIGTRNAFWYTDFIALVQKYEKEDRSLTDSSSMTKAELKKKLAGFIAYR